MNARSILDAVAAGLTAAAAVVPDPIGRVALLGVAGAAKAARAQMDASAASDDASARALVAAWLASLPHPIAGPGGDGDAQDAAIKTEDVGQAPIAAGAPVTGLVETLE